VPLRILALGRGQADLVQADVFLLTDREPATLPLAELPNGDPDQRGLIREVSEPASASLLTDLRSDRGMQWLPGDDMWLTKINVNTPAGDLVNDLAVDASGFGQPSAVAAGLDASQLPGTDDTPWIVLWVTLGVVLFVVGADVLSRRRSGPNVAA
jgi:hypothetical protein